MSEGDSHAEAKQERGENELHSQRLPFPCSLPRFLPHTSPHPISKTDTHTLRHIPTSPAHNYFNHTLAALSLVCVIQIKTKSVAQTGRRVKDFSFSTATTVSVQPKESELSQLVKLLLCPALDPS